MSNRRYWMLRILLAMLTAVPVYFGLVWADDNWWLKLAVAITGAAVFNVLEAPLNKLRKRRPFR